jgi:histidine triad (HIT) family protein
MPTIFTKIIGGEIPSHKVYEDDHVFAFLDINPLSRGHTLLVPKEEVETIDQLSGEAAAALGRALPVVCRAIQRAVGIDALNVLLNNGKPAGQMVPHVHFHIIPKPEAGAPGGDGLVKQWNATELDPDEGAALASDIAAAIKT